MTTKHDEIRSNWCAFSFDGFARAADPSLQPRWVEWVVSLGLDPNELLPDAAILVNHDTNEYELHVSKVRRKPDGAHWVDEVSLTLVNEPVIIPLGQGRPWPAMRERASLR